MGYAYFKQQNEESDVMFRIVEIYMANNKGRQCNRFMMVCNRRETLETVQQEMEEFVKTALMANRLETKGLCH